MLSIEMVAYKRKIDNRKSCHRFSMVRLSALDLNTVRTAVLHRSEILKRGYIGISSKMDEDCPFGENVKMIRMLTQRHVCLTAPEKDAIAIKYERGATMLDLAGEYGCHYTTVGRILRKRGAIIRDPYVRI